MNRSELLAFLRGHKYVVQSSVSSADAPQAAVQPVIAVFVVAGIGQGDW